MFKHSRRIYLLLIKSLRLVVEIVNETLPLSFASFILGERCPDRRSSEKKLVLPDVYRLPKPKRLFGSR